MKNSFASWVYNRTVLLSPYLEVLLRQFYWKNVKLFGRINPNKPVSLKQTDVEKKVDFDIIIDWLKANGIGEGSLLIVHSGYAELEKTGLEPEEIVDRLIELVGPTGTLAMPVIRRFKEAEKAIKNGIDPKDVVCKYDLQKTVVISGLIPYALMKHPDAVISRFPYNPLCAVGPLAKEMMLHNLDGEFPSPHGPNSCWKFCLDHDAKVCSIGTDIEHHNTITHVAEEAFGDWCWSDEEWYNHYKFKIIDRDEELDAIVSNRKDEWGKLHPAELNMAQKAKKNGSMISTSIEGITVGYVNPQQMISMLRSINKKGFPYYLLFGQKASDIR